jgi:hypothetical protein
MVHIEIVVVVVVDQGKIKNYFFLKNVRLSCDDIYVGREKYDETKKMNFI